MRALILVCCLLSLALCPAAASDPPRYLPDDVPYDERVPHPSATLGYEVGTWHVRHDLLLRYMETLAAASPRVKLFEMGRSHEGRRLVLLAFSSPENIRDLEALRERHLAAGVSGEPGDGPLVVWNGHSVHGNEPSGANMALLLAYHLAAGGGPVEAMLRDTIVLMEPAINPDGIDRFAGWANAHRSTRPVADRANREHHEVWPNGRTNHYWFDLNRDWLLLTHPESRARIEQYHRWRPHVLTDFHEMGSDATYFFQPGVPERRHPWTPERNHELTKKIGAYHARAFDEIGALYYSEESFDDFYYGKGSTYPDVNGTVGILFEQASSRGHLMATEHGELDFPTTIANQLRTALSTLEAADAMRDELRTWQAGFWGEALALAADDPAAAYVFADDDDPARAARLIEILQAHRIEVRELTRPVTLEGRTFEPGSAWAVPLDQRQYRLIKAIFELRTSFDDETFYDVSTFNLPLAFNLPFAALPRSKKGDRVGEVATSPGADTTFRPVADAVAYGFDWRPYHAPRALQRLLAGDFSAYVATEPMSVATPDGTVELGRGAIFVPLGVQGRRRPAAPGTSAAAREPDMRRADLEELLGLIAREDRIRVVPITSGLTPRGVDLGSPTVKRIAPVRPLLVVGDGVRGYDAGEVWHLLDTRVDLPLTMVDTGRFKGIDLRDYTHVLLVDGDYKRFSKEWTSKLEGWVKGGGVLVSVKRGADWVTQQGLHRASDDDESSDDESSDGDEAADEDEKPEELYRAYGSYRDDRAQRVVGGAVFRVDLDTTHPLGFGYADRELPVFRSTTLVLEPAENPYATVARYPDTPLLSGFASAERREEIAGTASIVATRVGRGTVVRMTDNPSFRGIWWGTDKLLLNALFFGPLIDPTKLENRER